MLKYDEVTQISDKEIERLYELSRCIYLNTKAHLEGRGLNIYSKAMENYLECSLAVWKNIMVAIDSKKTEDILNYSYDLFKTIKNIKKNYNIIQEIGRIVEGAIYLLDSEEKFYYIIDMLEHSKTDFRLLKQMFINIPWKLKTGIISISDELVYAFIKHNYYMVYELMENGILSNDQMGNVFKKTYIENDLNEIYEDDSHRDNVKSLLLKFFSKRLGEIQIEKIIDNTLEKLSNNYGSKDSTILHILSKYDFYYT